ncbi:MAG: hypothetical protein ACP5UN_03360 [Candidatus Micrarchaeia archaeon]
MNNTKLLLGYLAIVIIIALIAYIGFSIVIPKTYSINLKAELVNNQSFYPYSLAEYKIFVNNTSPNYIKNLTVIAYINNKTINNYYVSLPAHEGAVINVSYVFPSNGNYIFTAIADPADLLNIKNRANTTSSIGLYVNNAEAPSVYSSIPNNNILETRSFNLQQKGLFANLYLSYEYNLTLADLFGVNTENNIITPIFYSLLNYIANTNGAYVKYRNGTEVYSIWMQGPLNTSSISTLLNKLNESVISNNGIIYAKLSNSSSICAEYEKGWTKVLIGENQSGFNCADILGKTYQAVESNVLIAQLKAHQELIKMSPLLEYSNSISIGSIITSTNNSIGIANESINKYGFFIGYIQYNSTANQITSNTCNGMVFNQTKASVCATILPETKKPFNYTYYLTKDKEINGNYIITIYSLVNRTLAANAQGAGAGIISTLNLTGKPLYWESTIYKNNCSSGTNSLSCNIINISKNFSVDIGIKNLNTLPIHLSGIACYIPGFEKSTTLNITLASGESNNITTNCIGGTVSYLNPYLIYNLTINYTVNNKIYSTNGMLTLLNT